MSLNRSLAVRPELSPLSLLRSVWKHKLLGGIVALAITAAAAFFAYRLPAVYRAEAMVLVDPQKIPERFVASTVNLDAQDRLATISQEILSSTRLEELILNFDLYPEERKLRTRDEIIRQMRKDINIKVEEGVGSNRPGAFRISFEGRDPKKVAAVVNRITALYIEENAKSRTDQAEGTSEFIDRQLLEAKQKLDQQEQAVSRYKIEHNGELPEQENSLIAMLSQLKVQLQGNEDAMNRAQQDKTVVEASLRAAEATEDSLSAQIRQREKSTAGPGGDPGQPESQAEKQYNDLVAQLAAAQVRYTDGHPEVKRLRYLVAEAKRMLPKPAPAKPGQDAAAKTTPPVSDPLSAERARAHERTTDLRAQLASIANGIQARTAEHQRILGEIASYGRRIEQVPVRQQEMAALTRDYEFSKAYYGSLLSKKTEAAMATDLEKRQKAETFQILDPAHTPQMPVKPNRQALSAVGAMFGILFGLAAAIGKEMKAGVLLGEWELPAGVTILGRVPYIVPSIPAEDASGAPGNRNAQFAVRLAILSTTTALALGVIAYLFMLRRT